MSWSVSQRNRSVSWMSWSVSRVFQPPVPSNKDWSFFLKLHPGNKIYLRYFLTDLVLLLRKLIYLNPWLINFIIWHWIKRAVLHRSTSESLKIQEIKQELLKRCCKVVKFLTGFVSLKFSVDFDRLELQPFLLFWSLYSSVLSCLGEMTRPARIGTVNLSFLIKGVQQFLHKCSEVLFDLWL